MTKAKNAITVRMYNVGFGDCFLLRIPGAKRELKVLVDCGTIASSNIAMTDIVETLISDVTEVDGVPRIDVVIGTHRHADHVSGFGDSRWSDVEVKEIWLPWTEDPKDPQAKKIRETQSRLARALQFVWGQKLGAADADQERVAFYLSVAENALSNQKAMAMLHKGFKGKAKRHFLAAADSGAEPFKSDALDGVMTYVLGPSKSVDVIRDMMPPKQATYLKQFTMDAATQSVEFNPFDPFGLEWAVATADYEWGHLVLDPKDVTLLNEFSDTADPGITVALDKAVNGTSLVLVFELGDAVLLFPGDAQWGTWNAILEDDEARELLSRVNFFKVGHHGSHNATPKEFVTDVLQNSCCAMMSTKSGKWASIPRQPLVQALEGRTRLARSDVEAQPAAPFLLRSSSFVEATIDL